MEEIYIATFSIVVLLLILLLTKLKENKSNIYLAALLVISAFGCLAILVTMQNLQAKYFYFIVFTDALPALLGTLSYFYVRKSLYRSKMFSIKDGLHFSPFFLALILSFYNKIFFTQTLFLEIVLDVILKNTVSLIYIVAAYGMLKKYEKEVLNQFSNTENIDFKWLRFFVFLEIGIWLIYFGLIVIWFADKSILANPSAFINSIITIFILSISIFGIRYSTVFSLSVAQSLPVEIPFEPEVSENKDFSEKKPLKIKPNLKTEFEQLTSYFEQKQPFLNENLSLQDVSIDLNMHQRILSEIIGSQTGKNFFDFVNSYRVEYFNRQIVLPKNKNLTILAVAFECGFGSKSAFSRAYKKHSGITPSEFIKKNKNSKI